MSHVLDFRQWYRLNEDNKEIAPNQIDVPETSDVYTGPDNAKKTVGPIKLVVFSEVKEDGSKGWKGPRTKPYICLWPDNTIEFNGDYSGNRTLTFTPDGSSKAGIWLKQGNDTGLGTYVLSGITSRADAYKLCWYACRTLFGNQFGGIDNSYDPCMNSTNVKGILTAVKYIKTNYQTYVKTNANFNNFYNNMKIGSQSLDGYMEETLYYEGKIPAKPAVGGANAVHTGFAEAVHSAVKGFTF